ncbi:MAG: hypothetical protein Q4E73_11485 [Lachnospiraceae bacterium]|nr:hypothetical protein [Lachnospiraceae bacterium]
MDYWNIYKSVWDFHKKYAEGGEDISYWETVIKESQKIRSQYDDCKFVIDLLFAVMDELERVHRKVAKNADTGI